MESCSSFLSQQIVHLLSEVPVGGFFTQYESTHLEDQHEQGHDGEGRIVG